MVKILKVQGIVCLLTVTVAQVLWPTPGPPDCCYFCDRVTRQCVYDAAGGYSYEDCSKSCTEENTGYSCDTSSDDPTCKPSNISTWTKEYCEVVCGDDESAVQLCVYTCETSNGQEYLWQECISSIDGGKTKSCPGENRVRSSGGDCCETNQQCPNYYQLNWQCCDESAHWNPNKAECVLTDDDDGGASGNDDYSSCCQTNEFCPERVEFGWPCCDENASWDSGIDQCVVNDDDYHDDDEPAPTCLDGTYATFYARYSMEGGLVECRPYDCLWGKGSCPSTNCSNPTIPDLPICSPYGIADINGRPIHKNRKKFQYHRTFQNIAELVPPSPDINRVVEHHVSWRDQAKFVELHYNAKLTEEVLLSLDELESELESVECKNDYLTLTLTDTASAVLSSLQDGASYIIGDHRHGCIFFEDDDDLRLNHPRRTILKRVQSWRQQGRHQILVETSPASYGELFEYANVTFSTNHFDGTHATITQPDFVATESQTRKEQVKVKSVTGDTDSYGSWLSSFLSRPWYALNGLDAIVGDYVAPYKSVIDPFDCHENNNLMYNKSVALSRISWNYDNSTGGPEVENIIFDEAVTCTACYLDMNLALNLNMRIGKSKIEYLELYLEGQAAIEVNATAKIESDATKSISLANLTLPNVTFSIGSIPFTVQTSVPIYGGYDLSLGSDTTHGRVAAAARLDANMRYGFQYTDKDKFHFINNHTMTHSGGFDGASPKTVVVAQVYLMPMIISTLDHVGGPTVGFKGFVQSSINYEEKSSMCSSSGGAGSSYTTAWGLQLTLAGDLAVQEKSELYKKNTDNEPIWDHQWPLSSGCLDLNADYVKNIQFDYDDDDYIYDFFPGVQYVGWITIADGDNCDSMVDIQGGIQYTNKSQCSNDGKCYPGWVGVSLNNNARESDGGEYNIACTAQHYYITDGDQLKKFVQPADEPPVYYENCTLDSYGNDVVTLADLEGTWAMSSNLGTMIITPSNPCIQSPLSLNREYAQTNVIRKSPFDRREPDIIWGNFKHHRQQRPMIFDTLSTEDALQIIQGNAEVNALHGDEIAVTSSE